VKGLPLFRKNIKFKVVKPAEKQEEEAKTISEPENKPAEVKNEAKPQEETEEQKKLKPFIDQWARELTYSAGYRTPNTTIVEGMSYYVLSCSPMLLDGEKQTRTLIGIGPDLKIYQIKQTVTVDKYGILNKVDNAISEVKNPAAIGISADQVMEIAKKVVGGE
jgi:hypothetical protein